MARAIIQSPAEIKLHRRAGALAAETLNMVEEHLRPGLTTNDINTLVHEYTLKHDAVPAPLNYKGFPKSVCTSVNEVVCHGIPNDIALVDGDIINVDVTSILPARNGFYGDTSRTFIIGEGSPSAKHIVNVARNSLEIGLRQVHPGGHVGDIGAAIADYAHSKGCSVVREYTGHGIGRVFHGPPNVSHVGTRGSGVRFRRGMTFTIEPMINLGAAAVDHLADGWTVLTRDRSLTAQFEHTVVVTKDGLEILTLPSNYEGLRRYVYDPNWSLPSPTAR
jgi:methionyl aminopeptidase